KEDTVDEHIVKDAYYRMEFFEEGKPVTKDILMRNAMNEVLRDWYVGDCAAGVVRWNRILEQHGMSDRLRLPDRKFNRRIGMYSGFHFDPNGVPLSKEEFERRKFEWLPSPADSEYLLSIMAEPIYEPGKFANYIAPPRRGERRSAFFGRHLHLLGDVRDRAAHHRDLYGHIGIRVEEIGERQRDDAAGEMRRGGEERARGYVVARRCLRTRSGNRGSRQ